jgi:hypothetical protein
MKLEKNTKRLIALATIAFLAFTSSAIAAYWIYSNVVTVNVGYNLVLTYTVNDGSVTLIANLTKLDGSPMSGVTIHFFKCTDNLGTGRSEIGTGNTDSSGIATYTYTFSANGTYYFQAGYYVS